jgi:S1-C subfamily serine protease
VQIQVPIADNKVSEGTGFWVTDSGYVATCWHVVQQNPTAQIKILSAIDGILAFSESRLSANWDVRGGKVIAHDEINDIALIRVEPNPIGIPPPSVFNLNGKILSAHFAEAALNTDLPDAGSVILVGGYPLALPFPVIQAGIVAGEVDITPPPVPR